MSEPAEEGGFLSRWARRKAQVQTGGVPVPPADRLPRLPDEPPKAEKVPQRALEPAPDSVPVSDPGSEPAQTAPPLPTLEDVALLTGESDYSPFVAPGVDRGVRNAAMKKLFTDPHFNVMDGLDTYIDDYGKPDPIPQSMLRMMRQSKFLGLFDDEKDEPPVQAVAAAPVIDAPLSLAEPHAEPEELSHEDTDLRLQQDDAAGRPGPDRGPGA